MAISLKTLIRFHEAHPDWSVPVADRHQSTLPPEWEAAIAEAYGLPAKLEQEK